MKNLIHYYRIKHFNLNNKLNHVLCNQKIGLNKYNCTRNIQEITCKKCFLMLEESDFDNHIEIYGEE